MLSLNLQIEKVSGKSGEKYASRVFSNRVSLIDGTLGTLVCAFLIRSEKAGDLTSNLTDLFELSTKKLEEGDGGALNCLNLSKDACTEYATNFDLEVNFSFLFFFENVCYVVKSSKDFKVLVFSGGGAKEIAFEAGSGFVKEGQIYLAGSNKFFSIFDSKIIEQSDSFNLDEVIDGLATEISAKEDQSEICAAFVLIKSEEKSEANNRGVIEGDEKSGDTKETEKIDDKENIKEGEEVNGEKDQVQAETSGEEILKTQRVDYPPDDELREHKRPIFSVLGLFTLNLLRKLLAEVSSLKKGDIRAIFRLRKNLVLLFVLVIFVLGASGGWTIFQKSKRANDSQFSQYLSSATSKYNEGVAIIGLNKSRAREIFVDAQKDANEALKINGKSSDVQKLLADILGKLKETEISSSVDFETVYEGSGELNSLSSDKDLYAISGDKILKVNTKDKTATDIETGGISGGVVFSNSAFVISSDSVKKVEFTGGKSEEVASGISGQDVAVFVGNVYVLVHDQIAKFVPVEGGYVRSGNYLNQTVNFTSDSRMTIDGSVWVTNGSKVLNFLRGESQSFEISGISQLGNLGPIYTSNNMDTLYVVDKTNSALLVIAKDGIYKKSYQGVEFSRATDVVVDEKEENFYISVGSKILSAKL